MGDARAHSAPTQTGGRQRAAGALWTAVADIWRGITPRHVGWAFLLAWVFCTFYVSAVGGYAGGAPADRVGHGGLASQLYFASFPLLAAILTIAAVVRAERRLGAPSTHPALDVAAPVLCAAGTPLMYLAPVACPLVTTVAFGVGAIATGVGSGILWVMWGDLYATLNRDEVEALAPVSGVLAVALILLVTSTSGWVSLAMVTSFPLICGLALWASRADAADASGGDVPRVPSDLDLPHLRDEHRRAAQSPVDALRVTWRANLGVLACCVVVCVMGAAQPADLPPVAVTAGLVSGGLLTVVVALMATSHPRSVTAAYLFRWMCPLLLAGLGCLVWLPGAAGLVVSEATSIAARLMFCVFTQMYFALIAGAGHVSPTQAYGYGWIAVHLGDWVGVVLAIVASATLGEGALLAPTGVTLLMVALVTVVMLVLGRADADALGAGSDERAGGSSGSGDRGRREGRGSADAADAADAAVSGTAVAPDSTGTSGAAGAGMGAGASSGPAVARMTGGDARAATRRPADERAARVAQVARSHDLTPRETEVLDLLAQGRSVPYIRDALVISRNTASTHVKHVYAKLGVHSRQELIDIFSARPAVSAASGAAQKGAGTSRDDGDVPARGRR